MKYYCISADKLPRIQFAHKYDVADGYDCRWDFVSDIFEIAYCESGGIVYETCGNVAEVQENSLIAVDHKVTGHFYSRTGAQRHYTVAFFCEEEISKVSSTEVADYVKSSGVYYIIPEYISEEDGSNEFLYYIKHIIEVHSRLDGFERLKNRYLLVELLIKLTEYSIAKASAEVKNMLFSERMYYQRAVKYISENFDRKIYMDEIADNVGLSYGYLNSIFHKATGISMVEYINNLKIQRVAELIDTKNLTLTEAGNSVGITDTKYLSRLFKKLKGSTVQDYKKHKKS